MADAPPAETTDEQQFLDVEEIPSAAAPIRLEDAVSVGHWVAFVAGPSNGWDRTALGVAVYDDEGRLRWSRWAGQGKAEQRGDWKAEWLEIRFQPPESWAEMEQVLGRTGNAMSTVRWEGGYPTLAWDERLCISLYESVVGGATGSDGS